MRRIFALLAIATCIPGQMPSWVERLPSTTPPPLSGHVMVADVAASRVVLFGGDRHVGPTSTILSQETWLWDGLDWTVTPTSNAPSARRDAAAAYDPVRNRVVLFGGFDGVSALSDTWEWDGSTWAPVTTAMQPSPRRGHAMSWDPLSQKVVLFGGESATAGQHGDSWHWDGANWTQRNPMTAPSARHGSALAPSPSGLVLLFGGRNLLGCVSDTWEWDGASWFLRTPAALPPARESAGVAFDPIRFRTIITGGQAGSGTLGDTWSWDGSSWSPIPGAGPSSRARTGLALDPANVGLVLFGGGPLGWSDTWQLPSLSTSWPVPGQPNNPSAHLDIGQSTWLAAAGPGPFTGSVTAGSSVQLAWRGAFGAPCLLGVGPLNPGVMFFGAAGSLDIGTPPTFADVTILFDGGIHPAFVLGTAQMSCASGCVTRGMAHQSVPVPASLAGMQIAVQGLVGGPQPVLTAAFLVGLQ